MQIVNLEHDELEALYLCDQEELNQEEAGKRMGVSRGTVQRLLAQGRKKVIDAIVNQKAMAIGADVKGGREDFTDTGHKGESEKQ
jgi:predicted DNA-binding protein (UPF0251 family)